VAGAVRVTQVIDDPERPERPGENGTPLSENFIA
jgi:hypothetical protein